MEKKYRVFICQSDIFPGIGDYEDEKEIGASIEDLESKYVDMRGNGWL